MRKCAKQMETQQDRNFENFLSEMSMQFRS
jgi:hypothetical protein